MALHVQKIQRSERTSQKNGGPIESYLLTADQITSHGTQSAELNFSFFSRIEHIVRCRQSAQCICVCVLRTHTHRT